MSGNNYSMVPIDDIFDFPETNSKITKKFCNKHKGSIPVYASSKDEKSTLGYIQDDIRGVKYYENCLSWNRNGSVGYVFLRDHKFATNEDHRALTIKEEHKATLDKLYLKFEIERQLLLNGFSYLDKCGVAKIKAVSIFIPVNNRGVYDISEQQRLANIYSHIDDIGEDIRSSFNEINRVKIDISSSSSDTVPLPLKNLFEVQKGSAKYTKKYIHDNAGAYPVYSSQTTNDGEIGSIATYDFDEECFTWTTDGVYAGTVFYRDGKFSVTTHCGVLIIKPEYRRIIDYKFLKYKLDQLLPENTLGEWANKRLGVERIKELLLDIPIKASGEYDIDEQRQVASKYEKLQEIKESLKKNYEVISSPKVTVIKKETILAG